jgi:hypothetical protein
VPSWNFTFFRSQKVQTLPLPDSFHLTASDGTIFVVPGLSFTRPSNICSVTRNDSPSDTSAGSRYVGSDAPANFSVPPFEAPPAVPAATSTARAASGRASLLKNPLTRPPFVVPPPQADEQV